MSAIRYYLDAAAKIRDCERAAVEHASKHGRDSRWPHQVGQLESALHMLAARATLESQPNQIARRIEMTMDIDAQMAGKLIDAIIAALHRKYGDQMPDVGIYLGDAAQALYEFEESPEAIDDRDLYEEAALDAKHRAADVRAA